MRRQAHKRYSFVLYENIPLHQDLRRFVDDERARGEPIQRLIITALELIRAQGLIHPQPRADIPGRQVSAPAAQAAPVPPVSASPPDMEALQAELKKKRKEALQKFVTAKF